MTTDGAPMVSAPEPDTLDRWAWDYVHATSLEAKLAPPPLPRRWAEGWAGARIEAPGRPAGLTLEGKGRKTPSTAALRDPKRRAELFHTFMHHELQAAELMCWAALAFPEAPPAFRRGLLGIALDEVRHMGMYARQMDRLAGMRFGDLPVNDWFWMRVPRVASAASYCATMGMGFEGGNLDHATRFGARLRLAGDEEAARVQERVGEEEVAHVAFAVRWFGLLRGEERGPSFDGWSAALPAPLSPMLMRGVPVNREARRRAGMGDGWVDALEGWKAEG